MYSSSEVSQNSEEEVDFSRKASALQKRENHYKKKDSS
jgi:hypothetical protein